MNVRPGGGLDRAGLRLRLIVALAAILVASVAAVGVAALAAFDRAIEPELVNRTRLIGSIVRSEVRRALELGIPFDAIVGLDNYLSDTLEKFEEIDRISVAAANGQAIAVVERPGTSPLFGETRLGELIAFHQPPFVLPIVDANTLVGRITVETNPQFVQTRLRDVFLDVAVIALVATLVAMELALAVAVYSVGKPLDRVFRLLDEQRNGNFLHIVRTGGLGGLARTAARLNDRAVDLAARVATLPGSLWENAGAANGSKIAEGRPIPMRLSDLNDIRPALFLFSVATEIAAAFLPLYARAADRPEWLSVEAAAAAPLMLYLVVVAALAPLGGTLARRIGARRLFIASVPPTVLALGAMGYSDSLIGITFWRGIIAFFYATATISCQEYAIRAADRGSARPLGAFVAVVYGGVFCGSALGGIIAGRFGFGAAFVSGAVIAAVSGVLAFATMGGRAGDPVGARSRPADGSSGRFRPGPRFLALLLGVAVPMNAATAVFIWYLTPLTLAALGSGPAEIARVVMLYHLAAIVLGPIVAGLSDSRLGPIPLVLAGALIAGCALLSLGVWGGFWAMVAAVAGLGIGHTALRAPLYAQAAVVSGSSDTGMDALRLVERIGAIVGLAAAAFLLRGAGAATGGIALGAVTLVGVAVYTVAEFATKARLR